MAALDTIDLPFSPPLLHLIEGRPAAIHRRALLQPQPVRIRSNMDVAAEMTRLRVERGMTGEEFDARAGFSDRYTAKLEAPDKPWGKRGLQGLSQSAMHELWLEAMGMCLVLMTKEQARQIGAREPAARPVISAKVAA